MRPKKFCQRFAAYLLVIEIIFSLLPQSALAERCVSVGHGVTERAAIQDAFQRALHRYRGVSLETDTYVVNSQVSRDQLHAFSSGYVSSYELLDSHFDGMSYTVRLQLELSADERVPRVLGDAHSGSSGLRIGIWFPEEKGNGSGGRQNDGMGDTLADNSAVSVLAAALSREGFIHLQPLHLPVGGRSRMTGAAHRKDLLGANPHKNLDYVIVGRLRRKNESLRLSQEVPLYVGTATLDIQVIQCDTGESVLLNRYQESIVNLSAEQAENAAETEAGKKAGSEIAAKLRDLGVNRTRAYTISLRRIKDFPQISQLTDYLGYAGGAQNVIIKSYQNGNAVLTLDYSGENEELASLCEQYLQAAAVVTAMTSNTIELTFAV